MSVRAINIARMFELLDRSSLATADDAAVAAAIEDACRAEAAAAAARLAAIAELMQRRVNEDIDDDGRWAVDGWDAAAAEVAAAMGISHRRASSQLHLARALADRLPKVAELLRAGVISARIASTIAWRTQLVEPEALPAVDAGIAAHTEGWGTLSEAALKQSIDAVLQEHDPDAVRRFDIAARAMDIQFGKPEDDTGTASVFGRLYATDTALFERRIRALIAGVCKDDPRTIGQRRVDAMGVIAANADRLACRCGRPDCPQAEADTTHVGTVVIHVVAEAATVAAATNPAAATPPVRPALLVGGGVIPGPLLAELIRTGAKLVPLRQPCADGQSEPRYRPSTSLARFVRMRDLTCRFPGCSAPAQYCDIDHGMPYPSGPTHPGNMRCLCRKHHLLKTFWPGWSDQQLPDGTIRWTTPSGRTYTTAPGGRILLPTWGVETPLPAPVAGPKRTGTPSPGRGLAMPRRRRTRAADQAQHIKAEREANAAARAHRKVQRPSEPEEPGTPEDEPPH